MKKNATATALALLITGCALPDVYCSKQPCSSTIKETITHHFFMFLELGRRKLSMKNKICGGAENVVKTETQQTFVNGLLGFVGLYRPAPWPKRVCIAHNNCNASCPSIWATLSALLINILLGSSSCFYRISLSEGEIISFSGVCQSGEAALSTPEAVASRIDSTDCFDVQPTTTSGNIITQSIIFSFSIS